MGIADALAPTIPAMDASQLDAGAPKGAPLSTDNPKSDSAPSDMKKELASAETKRDADAKKLPEFPKLSEAPKPDISNDPIKGYVSAIGVLGAVGSIFTRRPLTNAMNAASGALGAMKANDEAAFKEKFEAWKVENDNAFKMLDYQQKMYEYIMKNDNVSVEDKRANLLAQATAFKDEAMEQHLRNGDMLAAEDLQLRRSEATLKAQKYTQDLQEGAQKYYESQEKKKLWETWKTQNPTATPDKASEAYNSIVLGKPQPKLTATQDKNAKQAQAIDDLDKQIDSAIEQAKTAQTKVLGHELAPTGMQGVGALIAEGVGLGHGEGKDTAPAATYKESIHTIADQAQRILASGRYSAPAAKAMKDSLSAIGPLTSVDTAVSGLTKLKETLKMLRDSETTKHYDTAEAVRSAYTAGELTEEEALQRLQNDFGYGE